MQKLPQREVHESLEALGVAKKNLLKVQQTLGKSGEPLAQRISAQAKQSVTAIDGMVSVLPELSDEPIAK
jgi:hypothetical protein